MLATLTGPVERSVAADVPPFAWNVSTADTRDNTGLYTSVALDANGAPYISYFDDTYGILHVAHRLAGAWSSEVVAVGTMAVGNTNIAVAPNGTLFISFFDEGRSSIQFGFRGPGGWNLGTVDSAYGEGYNRLALDGNGRPSIAYSWDNGWLRYAAWNGSAWQRETVDSKSVISRYIGLALDASGNPRISYYGDGILRYASRDGRGWTIEVVDHRQYAGWFSRLGLDSYGLPHIAYYDSVNGSLRYAERLNGAWFTSIIDAGADSGWDLSLTVDGLDRVHVAYYARIPGDLRYAIFTPTGWVIETVDTDGVVGWYTSVVVDRFGFPHIAYYDWTNGDLKYADATIALEVRTLPPAQVSSTGATLRGETVSLGAHGSASLRFALRPANSTNWSYWPVSPAMAAGRFSVTLANLTAGQSYEYRAEAFAGNETSVGQIVAFTPPLPTVGGLAGVLPILAVATSGGAGAVVVVLWFVRKRRRT